MSKIHFVGKAGTEYENTTPCGLEASGGGKDETRDWTRVTCLKCLKFVKTKRKAKMRDIKRGPAPGKRSTELHSEDIFLDKFGIQKVTNFEVARVLQDCPKDILEDLAVEIIRYRADE